MSSFFCILLPVFYKNVKKIKKTTEYYLLPSKNPRFFGNKNVFAMSPLLILPQPKQDLIPVSFYF